jgi:hypothetical protein
MNTNTVVPHEVSRGRQVIRRRPSLTTDAGKTEALTSAILRAQQARGAVEIRDLMQSGVTEADAKRLYDAALAHAKALDPALFRSLAA